MTPGYSMTSLATPVGIGVCSESPVHDLGVLGVSPVSSALTEAVVVRVTPCCSSLEDYSVVEVCSR
jgi:hypothetical protein